MISFGVFLLTESLCYNKECYVYTYPLSIYNKSIFRNVSSRINTFWQLETEFSVLSFLGRSDAPTFGRVSFARKFRMPDDQRHAVDTQEYKERERERGIERERKERQNRDGLEFQFFPFFFLFFFFPATTMVYGGGRF